LTGASSHSPRPQSSNELLPCGFLDGAQIGSARMRAGWFRLAHKRVTAPGRTYVSAQAGICWPRTQDPRCHGLTSARMRRRFRLSGYELRPDPAKAERDLQIEALFMPSLGVLQSYENAVVFLDHVCVPCRAEMRLLG
jgi:hypothetical protein